MDSGAGSRPAFIPLDTAPEAYWAQVEAYRRMGGPGRSAVMWRLNDLARSLALAGIRARHPDYDQEQARRALARLVLGDELVQRVWPGHDLVDP